MLQVLPPQIGTNCTSQRRKIGLASRLQQERARETSGSQGSRAAGSCAREDARLSKREDGARRIKTRELGGKNHALINGSFSFFASKDFSRRGLERCGARRLGATRLVRLAEGRRDCGWCRDWFRECCDRCCLGWSSSCPGHVLVRHRSVPHPGILGLLPVTMQHARCDDAASGNQADRTGAG